MHFFEKKNLYMHTRAGIHTHTLPERKPKTKKFYKTNLYINLKQSQN